MEKELGVRVRVAGGPGMEGAAAGVEGERGWMNECVRVGLDGWTFFLLCAAAGEILIFQTSWAPSQNSCAVGGTNKALEPIISELFMIQVVRESKFWD